MATAPAVIMLIEDKPDQAETTMTSLRRLSGVREILWLKNVASADTWLSKWSRNRLAEPGVYPQLILLSFDLADGGALDFLRDIKRNPATRRIPVIVLAGGPYDASIAAAYASGANSFMVKPIGSEDIRERLSQFELFWALTEKLPPIVGSHARSE